MTDVDAQSQISSIEPAWFRQVLGQYPTGVCVVTARGADGDPLAMVVGSFTSVSLDPPLVAFFPDRGSSSWAKLRECPTFCVNILAADQEPVCRKLASKDPDKFAGTAHRQSARGNPIVDGVVAWIECDRHSVTEAGDHDMVMGLVRELDIAGAGLPLLFFQGGYGRFAPASIGAEQGAGLSPSVLRDVDRVRPEMERLAEDLGARCIATVRTGDDLVVAASAGQARRGGTATLVGQRLPFAPPTGAIFAAWLQDTDCQSWLRARNDSARQAQLNNALGLVKSRGYSVGLLNQAQRTFSKQLSVMAEGNGKAADIEALLDELAYDPLKLDQESLRAVRVISAPVFDRDQSMAMALTLYDFPKPKADNGVMHYIEHLVSAANAATRAIGGAEPTTQT